MPRLLYVREPASERDPRLSGLLDELRRDGSASYRVFTGDEELEALVLDDLAVLLEAVRDPSLVLPAMARTRNVRTSGPKDLFDALQAQLAERRVLLVLDNFEHLLPAAIDLARLLEACGGVAPRFIMLETIQEYARERLLASDDLGPTIDAHADYFLGVAEHAALQLQGQAQATWFEVLEEDPNNLLAALRCLEQRGDVERRDALRAEILSWAGWAGPRGCSALRKPSPAHCRRPAARWSSRCMTSTSTARGPGQQRPASSRSSRRRGGRGGRATTELATAVALGKRDLPVPELRVAAPGGVEDRAEG